MSRPRAATSVATRHRISPFLNASSAFVRSLCARSEWIAVAATPCRSSHEASREAASLVRVNTSTWCQSPSMMRCARSSSLRSRSTG